MNVEQYRDYCLSLKAVSESFPFDEDALVFKVLTKMFSLTSLSRQPLRIHLKCDPDYAIELRERYESVEPAFHMNKKHWIMVECESGEIPEEEIYQWIRDSYDLVVSKMTKKDKELLKNM